MRPGTAKPPGFFSALGVFGVLGVLGVLGFLSFLGAGSSPAAALFLRMALSTMRATREMATSTMPI